MIESWRSEILIYLDILSSSLYIIRQDIFLQKFFFDNVSLFLHNGATLRIWR